MVDGNHTMPHGCCAQLCPFSRPFNVSGVFMLLRNTPQVNTLWRKSQVGIAIHIPSGFNPAALPPSRLQPAFAPAQSPRLYAIISRESYACMPLDRMRIVCSLIAIISWYAHTLIHCAHVPTLRSTPTYFPVAVYSTAESALPLHACASYACASHACASYNMHVHRMHVHHMHVYRMHAHHMHAHRMHVHRKKPLFI